MIWITGLLLLVLVGAIGWIEQVNYPSDHILFWVQHLALAISVIGILDIVYKLEKGNEKNTRTKT